MEADQEEEIRAKKRIKREMAQKASKESPRAEHEEKDPYPEEKIANESAETESESDKKNTTA
jgi:hypothetical protein